jgi:hypothetical protein
MPYVSEGSIGCLDFGSAPFQARMQYEGGLKSRFEDHGVCRGADTARPSLVLPELEHTPFLPTTTTNSIPALLGV